MASLAAQLGPRLHAPTFTMFRFRCACLLLCAHAPTGAAQTPFVRGRWVAEQSPLSSLDFRGGDTLWILLPIAAISANGRGTYEYRQGQLILHYGEGLSDTAKVTLGKGLLVLTSVEGETRAFRVAPARGGRSPLHGTWAQSSRDDFRLVTYLPDGVFFQEGGEVGHYAVHHRTVAVSGEHLPPTQFHIQIRGTDTVLTQLESDSMRFRRPRCDDPRLDPRKTFISACS